jgi:fructokinase
MNEAELPIVSAILSLPEDKSTIPQIIDRYSLDLFVLTRGKLGTKIYSLDEIVEGMPAYFNPEEKADSVGAGDACSAAILHGVVRDWPLQKTANLANQLGAYVASRSGATPNLPLEILSEWQT